MFVLLECIPHNYSDSKKYKYNNEIIILTKTWKSLFFILNDPFSLSRILWEGLQNESIFKFEAWETCSCMPLSTANQDSSDLFLLMYNYFFFESYENSPIFVMFHLTWLFIYTNVINEQLDIEGLSNYWSDRYHWWRLVNKYESSHRVIISKSHAILVSTRLSFARGGEGGTRIWFGWGCAADAAKHLPIFRGYFGRK